MIIRLFDDCYQKRKGGALKSEGCKSGPDHIGIRRNMAQQPAHRHHLPFMMKLMRDHMGEKLQRRSAYLPVP